MLQQTGTRVYYTEWKRYGFLGVRCHYSPVESEVDLDLGYIENVLTDYDSQHLQKQEST